MLNYLKLWEDWEAPEDWDSPEEADLSASGLNSPTRTNTWVIDSTRVEENVFATCQRLDAFLNRGKQKYDPDLDFEVSDLSDEDGVHRPWQESYQILYDKIKERGGKFVYDPAYNSIEDIDGLRIIDGHFAPAEVEITPAIKIILGSAWNGDM